MPRNYDSSRRSAAANQTRQQILAAAFKLHGLGITDFESLAREANVSLATVRKHFPNRETLFENCTAYGMHLAAMPDLEAIRATSDPAERTRLAVREVYTLQESLLGQTWSAYKFADESPALAASLRQNEAVVAQVADLVLAAWPDAGASDAALRGVVMALLSPLTYRALRVAAGLSPDTASAQTATLLIARLALPASGGEGAYRGD